MSDTSASPAIVDLVETAVYDNTNTISNVPLVLQRLYQSHRYANNAERTLTYTIPIADAGTYTVTLHFAEIFLSSAGRRVFSIAVNGETLALAFDPFEAAGGKDLATTLETTVTLESANSEIVVFLQSRKQRAIISGISVKTASS